MMTNFFLVVTSIYKSESRPDKVSRQKGKSQRTFDNFILPRCRYELYRKSIKPSFLWKYIQQS